MSSSTTTTRIVHIEVSGKSRRWSRIYRFSILLNNIRSADMTGSVG